MPPIAPVLVNVAAAGCRPFPALLSGHRVLALSHWSDDGRTPLRGADRITTVLNHWDANAPALKTLCGDAATVALIEAHGSSLDQLRLHAPVDPLQVYCTIGNYRGQLLQAALDAEDGPDGPGAPARRTAAEGVIETRLRAGEPYICLKGRASVAPPVGHLSISPELSTLDWEAEIGVVIGRPTWRVPVEEALSCVAGFCVVNDITLRERIFRQDPRPMGTDWVQSKSQPGWLPVGPWLVPAWNVPDPTHLRVQLTLNGRRMQDGVSSDMVFSIAEQIAYLSRHTKLEPGDLLCTGSPAGFGSHYQRFLQPGDVVEASVEGLGAQQVVCTAASPTSTSAG